MVRGWSTNSRGRPGTCLRGELGLLLPLKLLPMYASSGPLTRFQLFVTRVVYDSKTGTGIGIAVSVRSREPIRECPQKDNDQVFLAIRQAEIADRHVDIVRDLRLGPAVYLFG